MNQKVSRILLSVALYFLVGLLCMASFAGCTDTNIIPVSKIASGKVTLSWDSFPGAISYNIYFDRAAGLTKFKSYKIPNASNPITVTDMVLGRTYYFGITVVGESGESGILSEKSYTVTDKDGLVSFGDLIPESQNLKAQVPKEQVPEGQVTLSWDNVPNAVSYNIYWSHSPGVTKQNGKKIANVTNPYTFKGLERGKIYYFVVTALDNSKESKESDELSFEAK